MNMDKVSHPEASLQIQNFKCRQIKFNIEIDLTAGKVVTEIKEKLPFYQVKRGHKKSSKLSQY